MSSGAGQSRIDTTDGPRSSHRAGSMGNGWATSIVWSSAWSAMQNHFVCYSSPCREAISQDGTFMFQGMVLLPSPLEVTGSDHVEMRASLPVYSPLDPCGTPGFEALLLHRATLSHFFLPRRFCHIPTLAEFVCCRNRHKYFHISRS